MNGLVVPSIIANSQDELESLVSKVKDNYNVMQIDIMDGEFVENSTFNFEYNLPEGIEYEAHLMVKDPSSWIEENSSKVDWIVFHIEAVSKEEVPKLIEKIKSIGKKAGIAFSPDTPVEDVLEYVPIVDIIIVMTVYPGKYGAEFLPDMLKKVRRLREESKDLLIEVDGGMDYENIKLARSNGANRFISGSYLQKSENIEETSKKLKELVEGGDLDGS